MKFSKFYRIVEDKDDKYIPTKDEIRHFNSVRKGNKIDYSQDFHNKFLRDLYKITIRINDEKLRKSFSELIFKNMGSVDDLIKETKRKNELNPLSNKYKELRDYIDSIEGEN